MNQLINNLDKDSCKSCKYFYLESIWSDKTCSIKKCVLDSLKKCNLYEEIKND